MTVSGAGKIIRIGKKILTQKGYVLNLKIEDISVEKDKIGSSLPAIPGSKPVEVCDLRIKIQRSRRKGIKLGDFI